jgi:hypothetical protein
VPTESADIARLKHSPQRSRVDGFESKADSKYGANVENVDPRDADNERKAGERLQSARTQQYLARRQLSGQKLDITAAAESHGKKQAERRISLELSDISRLLTARSASSGPQTARSSICSQRSVSQSTLGLSRPSSVSRRRGSISITRSQELALQHMYRAQSARPQSASSRDSRTSRGTIDRLAQHKPIAAANSKKQYASYDDQRNCRFVPQTTSRRSSERKGDDDDDDCRNRGGLGFIDRQEAKAREKEFKLSEAQLIDAYSKMHPRDKKYCPKCKATQSYKEHSERIKKCPRCQVDYVRHASWRELAKGFHERQEQWARRVREEKKAVEAEAKKLYQEKWTYDSKSGTMRREKQEVQTKRWVDVKGGFLQRLQEELDRRHGNVPKRRVSDVAPSKTSKSRPSSASNTRSTSKEVIE